MNDERRTDRETGKAPSEEGRAADEPRRDPPDEAGDPRAEPPISDVTLPPETRKPLR